MAILWLVLTLSLRGTETASVQLGNEVLAANGFKPLHGRRVGLLTNPSGVNSRGHTTSEVFRRAKEVRLVALFAAEHGLRGDIPAGQEFADMKDSFTGLPIFSLYAPGPVRKPTPAMLQQVDVLVYDLQDTGCRSYTFISTMGMAMEACAQAGVEFMVLDRPNPLGGERVEGPVLNPKFRSLVGQWEIPYIYGLTCGELALMINREGWISKPCRLTVIPMKGWRRDMVWKQTGLPWVSTSPNVLNGEAPLYLAATGVLGELGGLSLGAGTPYRFQCFGAPWLDPVKASQYLNQRQLPGVSFKPMSYQKPTPSTETVQATRILFSDPARAPAVALNFYIWEAVKRTTGRDLFDEALKAGRSFNMFDKVMGTDAVRKDLAAGRSAAHIVVSWKAQEDAFRKKRQACLLAAYSTPAPNQAAPSGSTTKGSYTVMEGDSFDKIARRQGIPTAALMKANPGLDPLRLQIGQKLVIPEKKH